MGLVFSHNDYHALNWGHARHKDKWKDTDATFFIVDAACCSAMLIPSQRRSVGRYCTWQPFIAQITS